MAKKNSSIIDSKGRLFGKMNIIDLLIILFILLIVVVGAKLLFFKGPEKLTLIKLELKGQPDYIYNNLHKGDVILVNGENTSTIKDMVVSAEKGEIRNLLILAEIETREKDKKLFFGNQELKIGKLIKLATPLVEIQPTIVDFNVKLDTIEYNTERINVIFEQVKPWIADALIKGTKQTVQGETVATILDKSVKPTKVIVTTEDGEVFLKEHPTDKEVEATIEIISKNIDGNHYFQDTELYIGNSITFYFNGLTLTGQITSLQ